MVPFSTALTKPRTGVAFSHALPIDPKDREAEVDSRTEATAETGTAVAVVTDKPMPVVADKPVPVVADRAGNKDRAERVTAQVGTMKHLLCSAKA